jgi:hypothetical protein
LRVSFATPFTRPPKIFLTVQTVNGGQAVTAVTRNVDTRGFEVALIEEEALNDGHAIESLAYVAIENPSGSGNVVTADATLAYELASAELDSEWRSALGRSWLLQEEQSADTETWHTRETVHLLRLGDALFGQRVTENGPDPVALRTR